MKGIITAMTSSYQQLPYWAQQSLGAELATFEENATKVEEAVEHLKQTIDVGNY